jgi:tetratricopeptide (TPR) repeat protein
VTIGHQTVGRARAAMSDMVKSEMVKDAVSRAEELRMSAYAMVRAGELEQALGVFDEALAATADEELRELITINKADALVALERNGPEVHALPAILMRRRNPHHAFLAAYALLYKHRTSGEIKRAMFYGHHAYDTAVEAEKPLWQIGALNELGVVYEIDSQFDKAIECFESALALIGATEDGSENHRLTYGAALQNLGASKLLNDDVQEGIALILKALPSIMSPVALAEAYIDLCYGYLGTEELERARYFGEKGLELAGETRQVRNAHYLLGEVYYKLQDMETAEQHFDELARYYPEFRNLKTLLFALDLRSMLNLKL